MLEGGDVVTIVFFVPMGSLCHAAVLYWDKIMAVVAKLRGMLPGLSTAAVDDSEAEDYADWEM